MSARTPGPWALRGYQIRADNGKGAHVGTYQISKADGELMAAAPMMAAALEELLNYATRNLERMQAAMRAVDWSIPPQPGSSEVEYRANLCGKMHEASKLYCAVRARAEAVIEYVKKAQGRE